MADQRSQNFARVDPATGAVTGVFPGGVEILAGNSSTPSNERKVRWVRESDGNLVAEIFGFEDPGLTRRLVHRLYDSAGNAVGLLQLSRDLNTGLNAIDIHAGGGSKRVLDSNDKSDFVKLITTSNFTINVGSVTLTWAGGTLDTPLTAFNHGLGGLANGLLAIPNNPFDWATWLTVTGGWTATQCNLRAHCVTGVNPPAGSTIPFLWLAWRNV